jgi:hypothetical protein
MAQQLSQLQGDSFRVLLKKIVDKYVDEYGFMAVNAVFKHGQLFLKVQDMESCEECRLVHNELVKQGYKEIKNQEQYDEAVKKHGIPKAFTSKPEEKFDA